MTGTVTPVRAEEGGCASIETVESHYSPDLEYLTVRCRPVYLHRKFTVIMVTAVYILPDPNVSTALGELHRVVSTQQSSHLDAVHIAGDFNHAKLKSVLPKFNQHLECATCGVNTLEKVYSNIQKNL